MTPAHQPESRAAAELRLLTEIRRRRTLAKGSTPLELMQEMMREQYVAGNLDAAASLAKDIAPYLHPRMPARTPDGEVIPAELQRDPEAVPDELGPANPIC